MLVHWLFLQGSSRIQFKKCNSILCHVKKKKAKSLHADVSVWAQKQIPALIDQENIVSYFSVHCTHVTHYFLILMVTIPQLNICNIKWQTRFIPHIVINTGFIPVHKWYDHAESHGFDCICIFTGLRFCNFNIVGVECLHGLMNKLKE